MMIKHLVTIISASFIFFSCGNPTQEKKVTDVVKNDSVNLDGPDDCYSYLRKAKEAD